MRLVTDVLRKSAKWLVTGMVALFYFQEAWIRIVYITPMKRSGSEVGSGHFRKCL